MLKIKNADFDIEKIADSGQCFRMTEVSENRWLLVASDRYVYACVAPDGEVTLECPEDDDCFWTGYFDLGTDYSVFRDSADEDDRFLTCACEFGKGIRILRQDPWEMLITFIISQRRSIPSIKTCVERICSRWGREIGEGIHAFPLPSELASARLDELCECGLGYRAEYVYLAAQAADSGKLDIEGLKKKNDEELYNELLSLRGVGAKVANCVSLFGFHRIGAFPVDVWIDRVQKEHYQGRFPVERYAGYAGVMQQYIFYYIRRK